MLPSLLTCPMTHCLENRRQHNPDTLQSEFTDILGSVTELSHVLVAKVIGARSDQHTLLALHEFWEFFNATWSFVIDCEVLCRRMVVGLRGVLVGQVGACSLFPWSLLPFWATACLHTNNVAPRGRRFYNSFTRPASINPRSSLKTNSGTRRRFYQSCSILLTFWWTPR